MVDGAEGSAGPSARLSPSSLRYPLSRTHRHAGPPPAGSCREDRVGFPSAQRATAGGSGTEAPAERRWCVGVSRLPPARARGQLKPGASVAPWRGRGTGRQPLQPAQARGGCSEAWGLPECGTGSRCARASGCTTAAVCVVTVKAFV